MNPSFMAMNKAVASMMTMMLTGKEHEPKAKGKQETSINGRAFAPGKGVQQEVSSEAKEAKVRAHLDKLAGEAKARYNANSNEPVEADEEQAQRELAAQIHASDLLDKTNTAFKASQAAHGVPHWMPGAQRDVDLANAKIEEVSTKADGLDALHAAHAAYIDRQIILNRTTYRKVEDDTIVEPKYPTSDLIDALHEHLAEIDAQTTITDRLEAARKAAIHTGERSNLGTKFEAQ